MRVAIFSLVLTVLLALPAGLRGDVIESVGGKGLPAAATARSARGVDVEAATQNPQATFLVRVSVDRQDATYEQGELMEVSVESERRGYLYLLYRQADGGVKCLFPNQYDRDNRISGGHKITLPTSMSRFRLRIAPPLGDELLIALVTRQPLAAPTFGSRSLTDAPVTDVDIDTVIARGVNVELRGKPRSWGEHCVRIRTVPAGQRDAPPAVHQRLGLFIGISQYKDGSARPLQASHKDAQVMAQIMRQHGNLDGLGLLVNAQATRRAIQDGFEELRLKSRPGDEIFIYWSGHGGTCANTDPNDPDEQDAFLVPYDGTSEDIAGTMVLDDTMGRWIRALDGRKVCLIVDACYSAGQAAGKGAEPSSRGLGAREARRGDAITGDPNWGPIRSPADFLGSQMRRIKDIGQDDAAMLFSSDSNENSCERGDGVLSVMTYFLVEKLLSSSTLTLAEAYEHVRVEVPKYMKDHFPGREQNPQLVPEHAGKDVRLR